MKSLSLSKPHVLVTIGAPGVGKTFFAEQFAETFKAPLVSREQLQAQFSTDPRAHRAEAGVLARIADHQLTELLKTQRSIVVDSGAATHVERMTLHKKARDAGYEVLYIWVQTDPATAKHRAIKPARDHSKKNLLTVAEYETQLKQFVPPHATEKSLVISGKHTYATQAKVVLKRLITPRVLEPEQPKPSTETTGAGNRHILIR